MRAVPRAERFVASTDAVVEVAMKIGLLDLDGKIPNYALMKLARHWKSQGAEVHLNFPLIKCDRYFASKIFKDAAEIPAVEPLEIGGSGFDLSACLPNEIEALEPDYSIYPTCDYSLGFITRGCVRRCSFCVVPQKEGKVRFDRHWSKFTNPAGRHFVFLDNNFLAFSGHMELLTEIVRDKIIVDFNQGLDVRLMNESNARLLTKVRWLRHVRFSFDSVALEKAVRRGIELLTGNGLSPRRLMVYVLIGFDTTPEEDMHRVMLLRSLGADPFVMPFNRADRYQRQFARWVNHKAIFKSATFEEYARNAHAEAFTCPRP
jgi:hypothetical protein